MKWTKVSILTYTSYKADTVFHGSVSLNSAPIVLFLARFTSAILVLLLFLGYAKHPSKLGAFKISVPFIWNVFPQNDIWLSSSFYSLLLKCHLIRWHRLTLLAPWPALVFYIGIITTWQSIFNYLFVHHIYIYWLYITVQAEILFNPSFYNHNLEYCQVHGENSISIYWMINWLKEWNHERI